MAIGIGTLLLIAGGVAGAGGVVQGGKGAKKIFNSNKKNKALQAELEEITDNLSEYNQSTVEQMDSLGKLEMETLSSFSTFSELMEKISNKPHFDEIILEVFEIPEFSTEKLADVSTGAATLLAGTTGGVSGVLGGFAAAGAVKSAVVAVGSASTGTALTTLSGAALTNATLAAIGGGSLAAGGGGVALGTTILGVSTAGIALLIGGSIFNSVGNKVEGQVGDLEKEVAETERDYRKLRNYLISLKKVAESYQKTLKSVVETYDKHLNAVDHIVNFSETTDWKDFNQKEKLTLENLVLLVGLLYSMCQINLVIETEEEEMNQINTEEINNTSTEAEHILNNLEASY